MTSKHLARGLALAAIVAVAGACSDGADLTAPSVDDGFQNPIAQLFSDVTPFDVGEELWLMENFDNNGNDGSILYSIVIEGGESLLTEVLNLTPGVDPVNAARFDDAHIGADPDGETIWIVNRDYPWDVATYDVVGATLNYLGTLTYAGAQNEMFPQVAVSPSGGLYIGNQITDELFLVDKGTLNVTNLGTIGTPAVDLQGADFAFRSDGELYIWTNVEGGVMYLVDLADLANATMLGGGNDWITGLALRDGGDGDLLGSDRDGDHIEQFDKTNGASIAEFPMKIESVPGSGNWDTDYDHIYGDMTIGAIEVLEGCTYTQGYWKNHEDMWPAGLSPDADFFYSEMTWAEVFDEPVKGRPYFNLAHQWMAAALNVTNGASIPADVLDAWNDAMDYFNSDPDINDKKPSNADDLLGWAKMLDDYNNGYTGPGHCDDTEDDPS